MAAGAPPPPWSEELDGIGLRHSKQLQDYCIALRHDDRGFCEDLLEHGTNRVVHSIVAASTVDWTDDFLRGALLAAGRETVHAALNQFRLHQSRVDLLTYGELQAVLDTVPVMQRRWPPTQTSTHLCPGRKRTIGIEAPATEVRSACYLLSSQQIDTALEAMERATTAVLPQQLTVLELRNKLKTQKLSLSQLSLEWLTANAARVCQHRVNPNTGCRILRSPAADYDGTMLNPDPMRNDDIVTAKDALEVVKIVAKKAKSIASEGWTPKRLELPTLGVLRLTMRETLASAATLVVSEIRNPPSILLQAVATTADGTDDQRVLNAVLQASQGAGPSRDPSRVSLMLDSQTVTILSVIADKFGVLVLQPQRGTYMNYSDVAAAAMPLSAIPAGSTAPLEPDERGFVPARDEWFKRAQLHGIVADRRQDGACAAEAIDVCVGSTVVGDAIEAALESVGTDGIGFHEIDKGVAHLGVRLYTVERFLDGTVMTFGRLFSQLLQGVFLCEVEVRLDDGHLGRHYVMADCQRRIVCLGAGELSTEWLAGLAGFTDAEVTSEAVDVQLKQLRIKRLLGVRQVMVKASAASTVGKKRKQLNGRQRFQARQRL